MKKIAICTALIAFATPALANDMDHKAMHESMFKDIDTNGDGSISKEEHEAFAQKMFTEADTNGDGKVSKDEFMAKKMKEKEKLKTSMGDKVKTSEDAKSTTNSSATMTK